MKWIAKRPILSSCLVLFSALVFLCLFYKHHGQESVLPGMSILVTWLLIGVLASSDKTVNVVC